jgi:IS5 family transposase
MSTIDAVTPWSALVVEIDPFYPKGEGLGRPPIGAQGMLRMYIAQQSFSLADDGIEDATYDSQAIRRSVRIDLNWDTAPDATNLFKFRGLLVENNLTERIFTAINTVLAAKELLLREGVVVDATIIEASSSTKNSNGTRDPEMHQTKKRNQWHFGLKAYIGVDADSGLTYKLVATAANVSHIAQAQALMHGDNPTAFVDAGYQGVDKRQANQSLSVTWHVALHSGKRSALPDTKTVRLREQLEKLEASGRAKVEHPFHGVKNTFGHKKARYRGLVKNTARVPTPFGLANPIIAKHRLFDLQGQGAP